MLIGMVIFTKYHDCDPFSNVNLVEREEVLICQTKESYFEFYTIKYI